MGHVAGRVALAIVLVLGVEGCMNGSAEPPSKKSGDAFAADREEPAKPVAFDAKRAHGYLESLCKIGPRISGSEGMKKQQEMLEKHFKDLGGKIEWQRYTATQKSDPRHEKVPMANLIVSWHPERERRVVLCSHYDTRPLADREMDPRDWRKPFVSANDGGSGVALLMELAHHMKDLAADVGVDFVFFDGEEYVWEKGDDYFLGSRHFASAWVKNKRQPDYRAAVLLDMIASRTAKFTVEENSWRGARQLCQALWQIAR